MIKYSFFSITAFKKNKKIEKENVLTKNHSHNPCSVSRNGKVPVNLQKQSLSFNCIKISLIVEWMNKSTSQRFTSQKTWTRSTLTATISSKTSLNNHQKTKWTSNLSTANSITPAHRKTSTDTQISEKYSTTPALTKDSSPPTFANLIAAGKILWWEDKSNAKHKTHSIHSHSENHSRRNSKNLFQCPTPSEIPHHPSHNAAKKALEI